MIELLSPVGDFECLKAAVQNGANAVYFGSNLFSARAFAKNFDKEELEQAINYAKLRGVKTHLTLNTLIKDEEFYDAFNVAKTAYEFGIDAIIVQDLGLATSLIKSFPDLEVHASTQMTTSNIEGVKKLENLGFKRIVLSRECSISEIEHICKNSKAEIEVFAHGALCISYSGQCLFSSVVGGRSGNRGMCAQPCRLPYTLYSDTNIESASNSQKSNSEFPIDHKKTLKTQTPKHQLPNSLLPNDSVLDKGYLLSPRDLCSLESLPKLISAGVFSLKIEGRMKSPTYVATVTRIYRKYIDLAYKYLTNEISKYEIDEKDKKDLLQVFNRGEFSQGHLLDEPNKKLVYPQKPNNMGITLGKILKINPNKGLVTVKLENSVSIGDGISFENESTKYTVSELLNKNSNIRIANKDMIVTLGRMKGNIKPGDKIYKITDKVLSQDALNSFGKENIQTKLLCDIKIHANKKIDVTIHSSNFNIEDSFEYDFIPETAKSAPITKENIINQFLKTQNTCFKFLEINIDLDENLFIPTSVINDIRRTSITLIENKIINSFKRNIEICVSNDNCKNANNISYLSNSISNYEHKSNLEKPLLLNKDYSSNPEKPLLLNKDYSFNPEKALLINKKYGSNPEKALLLNLLNKDFNYSELKHFDRFYIPLKYFSDKNYEKIISILEQKSKIYIYMPVVIKDRFLSTIKDMVNTAYEKFKISGAVVSEMSSINMFKNTELIANYNFNVFNIYSVKEIINLGFSNITVSPELTSQEISNLQVQNKEVIVYGRIPLMTTSYCLLGKSNRCYNDCKHLCLSSNKYYLSDRYNFQFRIVPDNIQTLTTIYNSRNLSLNNIDADCIRFDILDETIEEINSLF